MIDHRLSRREFLTRSVGTIGLGLALPACIGTRSRSGQLLSAFEDARGDQYVGGLSLADGKVFGTRVAMRAHGCAVDPRDPQRAVFFARRPGTQAYEFRLDTFHAQNLFETPAGRHLSGHGVFSDSGDLLFTPEHDYENERGVISVRDTRNFQIAAQIDTRGIDPHEIAWLPGKEKLLVANGGILTHPRTFRRKLNVETMDPSLCVIEASSGKCLEQWRLPDHLLSIRHLSIASDGSAAVGLQYEGPRQDAPAVVATYTPGIGLQMLDAPTSARSHLAGYVASVCVSDTEDLIAASCPYGSGVACWSKRSRKFLDLIPAAEAYGLSRLADGSIYASQRDGTALELHETGLRSQFVKIVSSKPIRWDDHWVAAV
jgi:uncharacterized protein